MKLLEQEIADLISRKEWLKAFDKTNELIDGDLGANSMFTNFTGMTYYFNFLNGVEPQDQTYWQKYLNQKKVRELINVGNNTFNDGSKVEKFMKEDVTKSVTNELVEVIRNYNGQLEIIVAPVVTENKLAKLENWEDRMNYLSAPKKIWKVKQTDKEPAGYVKSLIKNNQRQFHYVTVRNAGRILPLDQPRAAHDFIRRFINNQLNI